MPNCDDVCAELKEARGAQEDIVATSTTTTNDRTQGFDIVPYASCDSIPVQNLTQSCIQGVYLAQTCANAALCLSLSLQERMHQNKLRVWSHSAPLSRNRTTA